MKNEDWIYVCLAGLVIALLVVVVVMYIVIQDEKEDLRLLHKRINNLLCDYEDNTAELAEVLQESHELINNNSIPSIPVARAVNDDW